MSEQTTTPEQAPTADASEATMEAGAGNTVTIKAKGKLGNCECQSWEIGEDVLLDGGDEDAGVDVTIETTGCDKQTKRTFAQGHDAKLKSLLIRAGVEGMDVRWGRSTGIIHTMDAETAADKFGFGEQVRKAILSRLDKLARGKKAIPAAPRTVAVEVAEGSEEGDAIAPVSAIPQAPADQDDWSDEAQDATDELLAEATGADEDPTLVEGKVGRWTYKGRVAADGAFIYRGGSGEERVADAGKWTPIA